VDLPAGLPKLISEARARRPPLHRQGIEAQPRPRRSACGRLRICRRRIGHEVSLAFASSPRKRANCPPVAARCPEIGPLGHSKLSSAAASRSASASMFVRASAPRLSPPAEDPLLTGSSPLRGEGRGEGDGSPHLLSSPARERKERAPAAGRGGFFYLSMSLRHVLLAAISTFTEPLQSAVLSFRGEREDCARSSDRLLRGPSTSL